MPDRTGRFVVTVQGYAGDDFLTRTVPFTGHFDAIRPPVLFEPKNANRAYMVVPQIGAGANATEVWVYETSNDWDPTINAPRSCETDPDPPPGELDTTTLRYDPQAGPMPYGEIVRSDYPWDRSYTHFRVWNLDLRNSTDYILCIRWLGEGRTEEWYLETPDGVEVGIVGGFLRHTQSVDKGDLTVWQFGISGCKLVIDPEPYQGSQANTPFPAEDLTGDDTYKWAHSSGMCHSNGWNLAPEIELQARYSRNSLAGVAHPQGDAPAGMIHWPLAELISKCTDPEVGRPPCRGVLEWRTQNPKLCGGPWFTPSCLGDRLFSLQVDFYVTLRDSNHRPDPLDWGFYPGPLASTL